MVSDSTEAYGNDDARWQAVVGRDPGADGVFFYAVVSTGIYCRPVCPSRRPKRLNVRFFDAVDAAQHAGFRPCLRCRPDEVSTRQLVVAQVQHLLDGNESTPSLVELGQAVGLSPYHLQRIFKRATGLSPRQYAAARRTERLKAGLQRGVTVTAAMYDAGYGSARALYETARDRLGMSPGVYRKGGVGQHIAYVCTETSVGRALIAVTERGLCAVRFGDDAELIGELRAEFPRAVIAEDRQALEPYVQAVIAHLAGERTRLDLPLDVRATAFQQRVWAALREIPYGQTRSYSEVAQMIGQPAAVRAVARACATNPVALAVPCHRVVRTDGGLSGYRWGVARKRALLDREQSLTQGHLVDR